jgi:universal stress protein A
MNRVLCATDLSAGAEGILDVAATMAEALGAPLEILHVVEPPAGADGDALVALVAKARAAAEKEIERRCQALAGRGISVTGLVETGRADEMIVAAATAAKPQLLILGTHGRGPLIRALVGSVAERSLHKVTCPLLIVPPGALDSLARWNATVRPLKITAGIDLSTSTETTLEWLVGLRGKVPCDITLVHLYWPPGESRRLGIPCAGSGRDDQTEIGQVVARELREHVERIGGRCDCDLRVQADWGEDEAPLARAAERQGADILVVGTSVGSGASTAIRALHEGTTAVLCVPGTAAASPALHAGKEIPQAQAVAAFTDLSEAGNAAVAEAIWLLRGRGLLTVCHVIPVDPPDQARAVLETKLRAVADTLIQAAGKRPDIQVRTLVHHSPTPAEGIVEAIGRVGPDVAVLGSRIPGPPGAACHVVGTTAETVGRLSRVSVVIAPPPRAPSAKTGAPCATP